MDINEFDEKTSGLTRPRVDRFVAPRESLEELQRRHNKPPEIQSSKPIWYREQRNQKNYVSHLNAAFGLEPRKSYFDSVQTWPCVPRKSAFLSAAENVLDLSTDSSRAYLIDWSHKNILVAGLGDTYIRWNWDSQTPAGRSVTPFNITCCRFDPTGEKLALGADKQQLEIHNSSGESVGSSWCRCSSPLQPLCRITAIDWSPKGNSLVTGCSRGMVTAFDRDAELIGHRQVASGAIRLLKVSPDDRYVAAATINTSKVLVLLWPSLEESKRISCEGRVKTIAWHPWSTALLGIGGITQTKSWVGLWDAPCARLRATFPVSSGDYSLDAMLFSHVTGELLLSLWNTEPSTVDQRANAHLVVMSGPDTVVDQWGEGQYGLSRVRRMVFSPDGTNLATAISGVDLMTWSFLPPDNKPNKKTKQKRFSAIDLSMGGFSLR